VHEPRREDRWTGGSQHPHQRGARLGRVEVVFEVASERYGMDSSGSVGSATRTLWGPEWTRLRQRLRVGGRRARWLRLVRRAFRATL
jgi:hypothetical protein